MILGNGLNNINSILLFLVPFLFFLGIFYYYVLDRTYEILEDFMKLIITKCKFTHKYLDRYLEKTPVNDFIKIHSDTRKEILAIQAKLEVRDDKFDELVKQSDRNARKLDEMNFKEPVLLPIWLLIILFLSSTFFRLTISILDRLIFTSSSALSFCNAPIS